MYIPLIPKVNHWKYIYLDTPTVMLVGDQTEAVQNRLVSNTETQPLNMPP